MPMIPEEVYTRIANGKAQMKPIIETPQLYLLEYTQVDFDALFEILSDTEAIACPAFGTNAISPEANVVPTGV